jgi:hypothetical protein
VLPRPDQFDLSKWRSEEGVGGKGRCPGSGAADKAANLALKPNNFRKIPCEEDGGLARHARPEVGGTLSAASPLT